MPLPSFLAACNKHLSPGLYISLGFPTYFLQGCFREKNVERKDTHLSLLVSYFYLFWPLEMFGDKKMIGPVPSYVVDMQVKARFKFQSLMQEYNDLHKESEEKRMKILGAKRRRNILLAEVGFLRQRFEQLMEYQDVAQVKHIQRTPSHPTPVLDLNQIAKDEEDEIQVNDVVEPMKMEKISINFSVSGSLKPPLPPRQKDLKLSVCRDIQKGPNRAGKRKISIQDVLTLRV